jgi:hypothetical protein
MVEELLALKSAKSVPSPKTGISLIPHYCGTKGCVEGAQGRNGHLLIILLRAQLRPFKVENVSVFNPCESGDSCLSA